MMYGNGKLETKEQGVVGDVAPVSGSVNVHPVRYNTFI